MEQDIVQGLLTFMQRAENLKNTLRFAYTSNGRHESTAEHSWRLCLLAMAFGSASGNINTEKLLKMAVIHDLGEAICGDIPAIYQTSELDKSNKEREGLQEVCASLPHNMQQELLALWDEYTNATTLEARIIKGLDKLETIMQHNQGKNASDFDYTFNLSYGQEHMAAHPLLQALREKIDTTTKKRIEDSKL